MLIRSNSIVQMSEFVDELWGQRPPPSALSTLQTYIYKIRKILSAERPGLGEEVLRTKSFGYVLNIPEEYTDIGRYRQLVQNGQAAVDKGEYERGARLLTEALALWRGPALADVTKGELLTAETTRLDESRLRALEVRIDADLEIGSHHTVIGELKGLTARYPLHEGFHAKLMLALHRSGRRYEALDLYRGLRGVLVEELGLEPSPLLNRIHQALLASDPAIESRPVVRPREVVTTPPPPVVPQAPAPAQLPADARPFAGRGDALDKIERVLLTGDDHGAAVRIVLITGMPGVGKTALAIRAAHQLRDHFPDGQLFAQLRASENAPVDAHEMLERLLVAIGVPPDQVPDDRDERSKLFRTWSAGRRLLLVLDDAACAEEVGALLPGYAPAVVIVTSRRNLLPGLPHVELEVLEIDEALEVLDKVAGRRRTAGDAEAARDILLACGQLPIAVRSVAARLAAAPELSLPKLRCALLDSRLRLDALSFSQFDVRHRYATSYDRLPDEHQFVFRLLSLVPKPDFTVRDATTLVGRPVEKVGVLLHDLVECHLLRMLSTDADGVVRFSFHELTRLYARERLDQALRGDEPEHPYDAQPVPALDRPGIVMLVPPGDVVS
jgi:DNA-binding SARP family transcriptional activator